MEVKVEKRPNQPKGIEEVVQYALGHRTRVLILITLNEGVYTASQLAEIIGEPLKNVSNHLQKMLDDGSIEIAKEKKQDRGNVIKYWYRAVEIQYYSQEEAEELTQLKRQMTAGAIVQSGAAEVLAALYAGKLADPRAVVFWNWYNVDEVGREALEEESRRHLDRLTEIEVESTNRRATSGDDAVSILLNTVVAERARKGQRVSE